MFKVFLGVLLSLCLLSTSVQAQNVWASWYQYGKRTANGEKFRPDGLTAAHRTLPFGTKLRLTYKGKSIIVRINDRGPFIRKRSLDLSRGAARALGCSGVCLIHMSVL